LPAGQDWGKAGIHNQGQGSNVAGDRWRRFYRSNRRGPRLNDAGRADVVVCDVLGHDGKWRNLAKRQLADIVPPAELPEWLKGRRLDAVIHLGAISETTASDGDLVIETNFRLSMRLLDWCTAHATPFIYASSASTYGDGAQGFRDDQSIGALKTLRPMNLYGWSKHLFDMAVAERADEAKSCRPQWAGLKFFQRVRPNEYHKGPMMSVLARRFDDIKAAAPCSCSNPIAMA